MDNMFEKAAKAAKNVGDSVFTSARNIGTSIYSSTKEQGELASLLIQKSTIEKKLTDFYAEIGRRYVEYTSICDSEKVFDVNDIMENMEPELEKLAEVKAAIAEKESLIRKYNEEKARRKAQEEFESAKAKLDKALDMDIITAEEYGQKLESAQRKLDNYELLRKINLQYEMGIITKDEYDEKKKDILG